MQRRRINHALVCLIAVTAAFATSTASAAPSDTCGPTRSDRCEMWTASYDGPAHGQDAATAIAMSPSGGQFFAVGQSMDANDDMVTIAYNIGGIENWVARYNGPGNGVDSAVGVVSDGAHVYVTGRSEGTGTGSDFITIAYTLYGDETNPPGSVLWSQRFDLAGLADQPAAITLSPNLVHVYVTGYATTADNVPGGDLDAVTIAYDTFTGEEVWQRQYDGAAQFWDVPTDVSAVSDVDGVRVAVTMRSNVSGTGNDQTDAVTIAYDGDSGEDLWSAAYNGPANLREYPYAIASSSDATRFYVTGESTGTGTGLDYITIAYDSISGAQLWAARHAATNQDDRALDVAAAPDGSRVFVTGFTPGPNGNLDRRTVTIAYNAATGAESWIKTHASEAGEAGSELSVSPDSRYVYVGGHTVGQNVFVNGVNVSAAGFQAIAYAADTGTQRWIAHLPTAGPAAGIALSANGGELYLTGGASDIVSAAYETGFRIPGPPIPTTLSVGPSPITAANQTSVTLTGTARPGDWMIIALAGPQTAEGCAKAAAPDGTFTCTVNATSLPDGMLEARARAGDNTGEYSDFIRVPVRKDTVAAPPSLTVMNPINAAKQNAVPVSGVAEPGAAVSITLSDGTTTVSAAAVAAADGKYATTVNAASLVDGTIQTTALQTDTVGNTSSVATGETQKDTVGPASPVLTAPVPDSTNPSLVRFTGTATPGTTIVVSEGTSSRGVMNVSATGAFSNTVAFGSGPRTATVRARDAAGNLGSPATVSFTVVAPATPTITSPAADAFVRATTTITGTATPGHRVRVLDGTRIVGTVIANGGSWSVTTTLSDGAHSLSAVAIDAGAAESAPSDPIAVTVDAKSPTVTIATDDRSVHNGTLSLAGSSKDERAVNRVEIKVVDQLGNVVLTVDADCATCGSSEGAWTAALEPPTGAYTIRVVSYDKAGNPSPARTISVVKV